MQKTNYQFKLSNSKQMQISTNEPLQGLIHKKNQGYKSC